MPPKILEFDLRAREKLLNGVNTVTDAVAATLGPKGRNVAIERDYGTPSVVHDGVTVAKEINLKDKFENMGAQLIKEAASKTNDVAGDGTTTSTILGQAVAAESIKNITAGANPMIMQKGIETATEMLLKELSDISRKLTTNDEVEQIATISAADGKIGKVIAEAVEKVGDNGLINVEESSSFETEVEYREGMQFDRGFASQYFITDNDKQEAVVGSADSGDAYILITDIRISAMQQQMLPLLERFITVSKNLVIIASEVTGDALQSLILNKINGRFNCLIIPAPGYGDRRKDYLQDIATLTGGTVISEDTGRKIESTEVTELGRARRIISTHDSTIIVDGKGAKKDIDEKVETLKKNIEKAKGEFDKDKLRDRLAKLTGGVAIIKVGALTEAALKDKKERVIDAVAATKAASEEGIVAGGEVALLRAAKVLENTDLTGEELLGLQIVKKAIEKPFLRLVANAGLDEGESLAKVKQAKGNIGIDVMDGSLKDLVQAGIIDPVKVTRSALANAVSAAIMIMTTHVLIANAPPDNPPQGQ